MAITFNSKELPNAQNEYVCWIDIMGTRNIMMESLDIASNFIFKFHAAVQESKDPSVKLYPLMDGVYVVTKEKEALKKVITKIFKTVRTIFIDTKELHHKFLIKGTISYGPIIHGEEVSHSACPGLAGDEVYRKSILMGIPMIQAYLNEKLAPPFGIFIHESARTFSEPGTSRLSGKYFSWLSNKREKNTLLTAIKEYFAYTEKFSISKGLEKEKSRFYAAHAEEYFSL